MRWQHEEESKRLGADHLLSSRLDLEAKCQQEQGCTNIYVSKLANRSNTLEVSNHYGEKANHFVNKEAS